MTEILSRCLRYQVEFLKLHSRVGGTYLSALVKSCPILPNLLTDCKVSHRMASLQVSFPVISCLTRPWISFKEANEASLSTEFWWHLVTFWYSLVFNARFRLFFPGGITLTMFPLLLLVLALALLFPTTFPLNWFKLLLLLLMLLLTLTTKVKMDKISVT